MASLSLEKEADTKRASIKLALSCWFGITKTQFLYQVGICCQ